LRYSVYSIMCSLSLISKEISNCCCHEDSDVPWPIGWLERNRWLSNYSFRSHSCETMTPFLHICMSYSIISALEIVHKENTSQVCIVVECTQFWKTHFWVGLQVTLIYDCEISSPTGLNLDVKKSSYKKLSKFLAAMQQRGFMQVKELSKGVESIVSIDRDHSE